MINVSTMKQNMNKLFLLKNSNKRFIKQIIDVKKDKFINKSHYDIQIPLNIFQTWQTKSLPKRMFHAINLIKQTNPRFNHFLYDDNDCRTFIQNNFDVSVLNAYDRLIPGAYKADLWRYCILYKYGGIYLDIKYIPNNHFKFINLCESEHYVIDNDGYGIYNALMVCKPNNQYLLTAINEIVKNVNNNYYGNCPLRPTGPKLLAKIIPKYNGLIDLKHSFFDNNNKFIHYKDKIILKTYNGHISERNNFSKKEHYAILWQKRKIYL